MANALVCNLCQREGKAAFATVHAEGKVGLGKHARAFDVDLCETHADAFAPLLAIGGPRMGRPPASAMMQRIPTDAETSAQSRRALQALARCTEPIRGPTWALGIKPSVAHGRWVRIQQALRAQGLVEMTGQKSNARFAITSNGRRSLAARARKKKAPGAETPSAPGEPQRAARKPPRLRRGPRQAGRRR